MNAAFVLMTTNYTLNPNNYYLWSSSGEDKSSSFLLYFPLFQLIIGVLCFVCKVVDSDLWQK